MCVCVCELPDNTLTVLQLQVAGLYECINVTVSILTAHSVIMTLFSNKKASLLEGVSGVRKKAVIFSAICEMYRSFLLLCADMKKMKKEKNEMEKKGRVVVAVM